MNTTDTVSAGKIIEAAGNTAAIAYATPEGDVVYGTARRLSNTDDVTQADLWVTVNGVEVRWPLTELVAAHQRGEFVIDP